MSPLSSSIGGTKTWPEERTRLALEQCLLHFLGSRRNCILPGPPRPPSLHSGTEGEAGVGAVPKQCAGRATEGYWLRGPHPQVRRAVAPQSAPLTSFLLGPGATRTPCFLTAQARRLSPPSSVPHGSVHMPLLQGTVRRQEGRQALFPRLTAIWPPPCQVTFDVSQGSQGTLPATRKETGAGGGPSEGHPGTTTPPPQ